MLFTICILAEICSVAQFAVIRDEYKSFKNEVNHTKEEYFIKAYDCSDAPFVANISVNSFSELDQKKPYESKPVSVQLIQNVVDEHIEVHEVIVEQTETVQQCGQANWADSWWHELVTHVDWEKYVQLKTDEVLYDICFAHFNIHFQMKNFMDTKTLKLGTEYGTNKWNEFLIKLGINRFFAIPVGKIKHQYRDNR